MVHYSIEHRGKFTFTFSLVLYCMKQNNLLDYHIWIFSKCSRRNFKVPCNSVVSMETMLWAGYPNNHGSVPDRIDLFSIQKIQTGSCDPPSLLFIWDKGILSLWVKLIAHSKTVARSRMCRASYLPIHHMPSWCLQGQPTFTLEETLHFTL